jgi:steroid delta-isomerase-like uncharacterized protein
MSEENKAVAKELVEVFNRGDLDALDRLVAADFVDHDPSRASLPPGPEGIKQAWSMFRAAFPDLRGEVTDMVAEGDMVAVRAEMRGTHRGELMGIPPTGNRITITLLDINRLRDGKLVERWAQADMLGMMQQLGVVPRSERRTEGKKAMSTEENKALIRRFIAAADRLDFEEVMECLSPDLTVHIGGMPGPLDLATFLQFGQAWHSAFPDEKTTFEDQIAEGDKVVSRMTSKATHTGSLQGIPPTEKRITVTGIWIERVSEGRIAERWGQVDMLGVMRQLGVIPSPVPSET